MLLLNRNTPLQFLHLSHPLHPRRFKLIVYASELWTDQTSHTQLKIFAFIIIETPHFNFFISLVPFTPEGSNWSSMPLTLNWPNFPYSIKNICFYNNLSMIPFTNDIRTCVFNLSTIVSDILWQNCPVGWGCRTHRLHTCSGVKPHQRISRIYDSKQPDGEVPVILDLWGMQSTSSLPSLPCLPGVVKPDRILSMGQKELNCVLMLHWIVWNRTVLLF